eukprot:gnl/TRDRNA2_/TRDRNA2_127819_c0_seq1.p1 gnl/TRDRNA2_/TRDRNA2_127819_c0~~gnl/TRDRNA2_/TRDRNA2_127819_c0_seq1.p1  ORF type:complete len:275 (-),score=69.56 gnl/TRDRNA2_/TRDRNA2_127819_c0_seq1:7-831(-)
MARLAARLLALTGCAVAVREDADTTYLLKVDDVSSANASAASSGKLDAILEQHQQVGINNSAEANSTSSGNPDALLEQNQQVGINMSSEVMGVKSTLDVKLYGSSACEYYTGYGLMGGTDRGVWESCVDDGKTIKGLEARISKGSKEINKNNGEQMTYLKVEITVKWPELVPSNSKYTYKFEIHLYPEKDGSWSQWPQHGWGQTCCMLVKPKQKLVKKDKELEVYNKVLKANDLAEISGISQLGQMGDMDEAEDYAKCYTSTMLFAEKRCTPKS